MPAVSSPSNHHHPEGHREEHRSGFETEHEQGTTHLPPFALTNDKMAASSLRLIFIPTLLPHNNKSPTELAPSANSNNPVKLFSLPEIVIPKGRIGERNRRKREENGASAPGGPSNCAQPPCYQTPRREAAHHLWKNEKKCCGS